MPRIPIHPGEILADELQATGSTAPWLARTIGVPQRSFLQIISGKRPITADIALRLETVYAVNPKFWMNLQTIYDQDRARQESEDVIRKTALSRRHQKA